MNLRVTKKKEIIKHSIPRYSTIRGTKTIEVQEGCGTRVALGGHQQVTFSEVSHSFSCVLLPMFSSQNHQHQQGSSFSTSDLVDTGHRPQAVMTSRELHLCTDHQMSSSARSGPSVPPALSPFGYGGTSQPTLGSDLGLLEVHDSDCAVIETSTSRLPPPATLVRGHRRRSVRVTRGDLVKFGKEVLGIEDAETIDDEAVSQRNTPKKPVNSEEDPELEQLSRAFRRASMSLNGGGMANNGPGFTNYMDNSPNTPNLANIPRQSPSPSAQHAPGQVNGGGGMAGMNMGMPNAGHQMDLNYLWEMVQELSEVLKYNREMTKGIISSAEEIMVCLSSPQDSVYRLICTVLDLASGTSLYSLRANTDLL